MPKRIEMKLLCDLDDDEVGRKAQEIAVAIVDLKRVERKKAEASKMYADELTGIRERMELLSEQVTSRTEHRMVPCQVDFHRPQVGFKRTVRLDTGEVVLEEPMSDAERQQRMFEAESPPEQAGLGIVEAEDPQADSPETETS